MSKKKFELSSKQKNIIELIVNLPEPKDIGTIALMEGTALDCIEMAFDTVCNALRILSKDTNSENICNDLIEKANKLYSYERQR